MALSRRIFLEGSGAAALSLWQLGASQVAWGAAGPRKTAGNGRSLVVIQLAGGNDGLNTVVPFTDAQYKKLRPGLALTESEMLPVDATVAFNSALSKLHARYQQGGLAIIQGVGYPKPNRSHFESTAYWQTAVLPPARQTTGWLGRAFEDEAIATQNPLIALGIGGGGLTPAFYSEKAAITCLSSLEAFAVQPDKRFPGDAPALNAAIAALYTNNKGQSSGTDFIRHVGQSALHSSGTLGSAVRTYTSMVEYPKGPLGDQLKLVAQLLSAELGVRVFHVTLGGFDTHANQKRQQATLLGQLSDGITALLDDAAAHGFADRLAVMTYSEFGRRAGENGSNGTDHGTASVAMLAGTKVRGGLHGPIPNLSKLEGGDVPFTVDFRGIYSSVLHDWMGVPAENILRGKFAGLSLFKA